MWEYKVVHADVVHWKTEEEWETKATVLGKQGWKLTHVTTVVPASGEKDPYIIGVFERYLHSDSPEIG